MKVHQIRIDFNVTKEIKRYVFVYIIEAKYCYLVDSGVSGCQNIIESYLESIGRSSNNIKGIFLTHAHPDHIGTSAYFQEHTGCKVYASQGEKRWIEDIDLEFKERPIPNFYALAGKSAKVNQIVKDLDVIDLEENLKVTVIETPGHSSDELSFIINDMAFIGDAVLVKNDIPIYINKEKTLHSLKRIKELNNIKTFYPAWDKTYSFAEMNEKIKDAFEVIESIDIAIQKALLRGNKMKIEDLCKEVAKELQKPFLTSNPLFIKTIESHLK